MDATEQGFLKALREDAEDCTTRLVYADWLDDRDDPRGSFLREEVELASLPVGEKRARALQARLGQVVMPFDPEWVTNVSLLAHRLSTRWLDLEKTFVPYHGDRQSIVREKRCAHWQSTIIELGHRFTSRFSDLAADRFRIPLDYTLFQIVIGTGWFRDVEQGDELRLLSIDSVRASSEYWLGYLNDESLDPNGLWVSIGRPWSDHCEHHLCCDDLHPAFGSVYESIDDCGAWDLGAEQMKCLAPSFLDYLRTITP